MKYIHFLIILGFSPFLLAQTGGETSFPVLDLPFSARSAALGNDFISSKDQDLNLAVQNPSLINEQMHKHLGFNQAFLASGINYGMLTYARTFSKIHSMTSLRYVNYGNMDRYDETGQQIGQFYAGDFILGTGIAKQINPLISVGANLNLIYSQYEANSAFGMSVDLAGTYELKEKNLTMTALVKNAGYQFKSITKDNRAPLPTEFQFAIAHKVKHAPFRFTLLIHHLNKFDLTYSDPNAKPTIDALTGDTIPVKLPGLGEKTLRHFTYQVELILSKNFHVRTAFDYHRRQELKVSQKPGIAGFSFGLGMYFKRFSLDYGIIAYSAAGFNNVFTLTTNLEKWKR
jgi:hypothetical protein